MKLLDVQRDELRRFVYIAAGDDYLFDAIGPGQCSVLFALGTDWNGERGEFNYTTSAFEFYKRLDFEEHYTDDGVEWATFKLTLHPVVGGTAKTKRIPAKAFYAVGSRSH